jgi:hypothetical protein
MLFEEGNGRADLSGGAVATLKAVMFEKSGLNGVEGVALSQTFDGGDLGSLSRDREGETGVDTATVDENGACSAF